MVVLPHFNSPRVEYRRGQPAAFWVLDCVFFESCCFCAQCWGVEVGKLRCGTLRFAAGGRPHVSDIVFENVDLRKKSTSLTVGMKNLAIAKIA